METTSDQTRQSSRERVVLQVAGSVAVVVLLFSTMLSVWATAIVAGGALVGLLLYAWFSLRGPARGRFMVLAIAATVLAGAIGAAVARFM